MINTEKKKKWTLMFFFASDNVLSPSMLSQLQALKAAGFQKDTNVLAYFDPNEKGAPTRFFEINKNEKLAGASNIGGVNGPFVSDLAGDNIGANEITKTPGQEATNFIRGLGDESKLEAKDALANFLSYCRVAYPADHYMLFLLGHGLVVGLDAFLPDDNPDSAITLKELGTILRKFSLQIGQGKFELVGMHSCSMSAIEVVYELKDTANYMIASQGISFVGSWPYRPFLIEIFRAVEAGVDDEEKVLKLMRRLHQLGIHHSADFIFAGYSADLCLSRLGSENLKKVGAALTKLVTVLSAGVGTPVGRELIRLAHLESQSYWEEMYSDLYDFCFCLSRRCAAQPGKEYNPMKSACDEVIQALAIPKADTSGDGPVVFSDYFGPDCQYSHGLSVFFPWFRPIENWVMEKYRDYAFTAELRRGSWFDFLESYFRETMRKSRREEDGSPDISSGVAFKTVSSSVPKKRRVSVLGGVGRLPSTALPGGGKTSPPDAAGGQCTCLSIKNYPRDFAISPGTLTFFE